MKYHAITLLLLVAATTAYAAGSLLPSGALLFGGVALELWFWRRATGAGPRD